MKLKTLILALSAAIALPAAAQATQIEAISGSIFSAKASTDADGRTASVITLGEPAKEKPAAKRNKRIGFVPTVPPPPGGEEEEAVAEAPATMKAAEAGDIDPTRTADVTSELAEDSLRGGLEPLPANANGEEMQIRLH